MGKPVVDIMVLTYNRLVYTKLTFESLFKNTTWPYRLVVTDNGSVDGTREYLRELLNQGKIDHIFFPKENLGNAGGKNFELKEACTPYVCLLDNDMHLMPGWLTRIMEHLLHFKEQKLALMSPWPIWKVDEGLAAHKKHKVGDLKDKKFHVYLTRKLSGQVWVGVRKLLLKYGGFGIPDNKRFMGFFASPLSKKLVKAGYKIGCVAGEELAISMDRKDSPMRIMTPLMKQYRAWNRLQKNKKQKLPDFHIWLEQEKKSGK